MAWWLWILVGAGLLVAELFLPSDFFFFFFGVAAVLVGILEVLGVSGPASTQWLLFSVLAIALTLGLRRKLRAALSRGDGALAAGSGPGSLVGDLVVVAADVPDGDVGKAELRGTSWTIRHVDAGALRSGQRCRVERVDGLTLWVRPSAS